MKRILTWLLSISLAFTASKGWAQTDSIASYPLLNGLSVSVNLFPPILNLFGKNYGNLEAMATLDLYHRFLPQVAAGIGYCDHTNDDGIHYKTSSSPFFKLGMVYHWAFKDPKNAHDFYGAFLRYGFSHNEADISGLTYTDGYWPEYGPGSIHGLKSNSHWLELGGMIKVQIVNHISMGWDLSFKPFLHKGKQDCGNPYFVSGYGSTSSKLGFAFHLYYDLW